MVGKRGWQVWQQLFLIWSVYEAASRSNLPIFFLLRDAIAICFELYSTGQKRYSTGSLGLELYQEPLIPNGSTGLSCFPGE
jgi:hypothetical protein